MHSDHVSQDQVLLNAACYAGDNLRHSLVLVSAARRIRYDSGISKVLKYVVLLPHLIIQKFHLRLTSLSVASAAEIYFAPSIVRCDVDNHAVGIVACTA